MPITELTELENAATQNIARWSDTMDVNLSNQIQVQSQFRDIPSDPLALENVEMNELDLFSPELGGDELGGFYSELDKVGGFDGDVVQPEFDPGELNLTDPPPELGDPGNVLTDQVADADFEAFGDLGDLANFDGPPIEIGPAELGVPELGVPEAPEIIGNWGAFSGDVADFAVDGAELVGTGLEAMDVATVAVGAGVGLGEVFSIVMLPLGAAFGIVMQAIQGQVRTDTTLMELDEFGGGAYAQAGMGFYDMTHAEKELTPEQKIMSREIHQKAMIIKQMRKLTGTKILFFNFKHWWDGFINSIVQDETDHVMIFTITYQLNRGQKETIVTADMSRIWLDYAGTTAGTPPLYDNAYFLDERIQKNGGEDYFTARYTNALQYISEDTVPFVLGQYVLADWFGYHIMTKAQIIDVDDRAQSLTVRYVTGDTEVKQYSDITSLNFQGATDSSPDFVNMLTGIMSVTPQDVLVGMYVAAQSLSYDDKTPWVQVQQILRYADNYEYYNTNGDEIPNLSRISIFAKSGQIEVKNEKLESSAFSRLKYDAVDTLPVNMYVGNYVFAIAQDLRISDVPAVPAWHEIFDITRIENDNATHFYRATYKNRVYGILDGTVRYPYHKKGQVQLDWEAAHPHIDATQAILDALEKERLAVDHEEYMKYLDGIIIDGEEVPMSEAVHAQEGEGDTQSDKETREREQYEKHKEDKAKNKQDKADKYREQRDKQAAADAEAEAWDNAWDNIINESDEEENDTVVQTQVPDVPDTVPDVPDTVPDIPQPAWVEEHNTAFDNIQKEQQDAHMLELCKTEHRHLADIDDHCIAILNKPYVAESKELAIIRAPPVFSNRLKKDIQYASATVGIIALVSLL